MKPRLQWAVAAGLTVMLFVAETIGLHSIFTSRNPGGNDLLPRWVATRAWLLEGLSPYDPQIEARAQRLIYGRLATNPGEDLARFLYLPYAMVFVAPVALLPFDWAHAAWMTALQFCLAAMCIVSLRLYRWTPPAWLAAAIILWSILVYPGARSIVLGQLTLVMALLITLGLWAVRERHDILAGVLLALSTAKPTLAILLIPFVFLWSVQAGRRRLALALAGSLIVLAGFSFVVAPDWPRAVLQQTRGYATYTEIGSVSGILAGLFGRWSGNAGEYAISLMLGLWMVWEWWRSRTHESHAFEWAAAVTLVVTLIVSPRTGTTSQPMLVPILIMLFARVDKAQPGRRSPTAGGLPSRRAYMILTLLVALVGLWWLFLTTVSGRVEQPPVYLPLPLGVAGALALAGRPDAPRFRKAV